MSYFDDIDFDLVSRATNKPTPKKEPQKRGAFGAINDTVIEFANAAVGGVGAAADFVAPGNGLSSGIDDFIKSGEEKQSDVVKAGKAEFRERLDQSGGVADDLSAVGSYIVNNPLQTMAQAAGSFAVPGAAIKGANLAARGVGASVAGGQTAGRVAGIGAGAAMGGGDAGGNAYDLVMATPDEVLLQNPEVAALVKSGAPLSEVKVTVATKAARQASVLPAIAGGVAGAFGAEKLLAAGGVAKSGLRSVAATAGIEGVTEGAEEGLAQYEGQRAAQTYNPSIDPTKNVAAMAGMGAIMGAGTGGAVAALSGQSQEIASPAAPVDPADSAAPVVPADPVAPVVPAGTLTRATAAMAPSTLESIAAANAPAPEPIQEPVEDAYESVLQNLPETERALAMKAYAVVKRDDVAKGVKMANQKLLDGLVEKFATDTQEAEEKAQKEPAAPATRAQPAINSIALDSRNVNPETGEIRPAFEVREADRPKQQADDILNAQNKPFTNLGAAKRTATALGDGFAPFKLGTNAFVVRKSGGTDVSTSTAVSDVSTDAAGSGGAVSSIGMGAGVGAGNPAVGAVDAGNVRAESAGDAVPSGDGRNDKAVDVQNTPPAVTAKTETPSIEATKAGAPVEARATAAGTAAGAGAVEAAGVDTKAAAAKEVSVMSDAEVLALRDHYKPANRRHAKIAQEIEKRGLNQAFAPAEKASNAIENGALIEGSTAKNADAADKVRPPATPTQDRTVQVGGNNTPLSEGGSPFKTKLAATTAKKLQPVMRVVRVEGGYALAEKTPAQLAAEVKAARRLRNPQTSPAGEAIPAHAMIAAEGGLAPAERADMGMEGNVSIGNRKLFAGIGRGLTIERATEKLIEDGYLPDDASHQQARDLIKRSLNNPQYTPEGTERMAEKEAVQREADYNAEQEAIALAQEAEDNALADAADAYEVAVLELPESQRQEDMDFDAALLAAGYTQQEIEDDQAIAVDTSPAQAVAATDQSPVEAATGARPQSDSGREGAPGAVQGQDTGLTSPTKQEVLDQQQRAADGEKANASQRKADQERLRRAQERKDIAKASEAAAGTFELGGSAEQNLSGQQDVFGNPPADQPSKTSVKQFSSAKIGKIEDAGAVLEGAAKLYAKAYFEKFKEGIDMDIAAVPLSKSWPEPDYQRMLEDGADPWALAFARAARDEVPNKPGTAWKVKGWAAKVQLLRGFAGKVLDGTYTKDQLVAAGDGLHLSDWFNKIDLYEAVGHSNSLKGLKFTRQQYSLYGGQTYSPAKVLWTVNQPSNKALSTWSNGNWGKDILVADTKPDAIEKFKAWTAEQGEQAPTAAKATTFDIYSYRSKPGVFIVGKRLSAGSSIDLKEFATVKEAREYKTNNQAELEKLLEAEKYVPPERKETNAPRVGADHRNGADVTNEEFREAFGFRGEQFGQSMPQNERQSNLNQTYDALMDLAGVIGVPPKALSLNGELGMAFGARGKGGKRPAAAHYEADTTGAVTPNRVVINLTRKNGAGSLAHEWFHAVDNYFARKQGQKSGFMTERIGRDEGVRKEMKDAFTSLMRSINSTALAQRSKELDKTRSKAYWSTGLEMAARSFESYVIAKLQDQNGSNDYLANIVSETEFAKENAYPYLTAGELPTVRAAFDHFFSTVQTREDEAGNVAMFSRTSGQVAPVSPSPEKTPLYEAFRQLIRFDDSFQLTASTSKDLDAIASDMQAGVKGKPKFTADKGTALHQGNRKPVLTLRTENDQGTSQKLLDIFEADTDRPFVVIGNSELGQGVKGAQAYQIAFAWAHNNGKTMRPDPAGLTVVNRLRRTEAMISSALRYGTTQHLEPHQDQYVGLTKKAQSERVEIEDTHFSGNPDAFNELEALKGKLWTAGNSAANIASNVQHLIEASGQLAAIREPTIKGFEVVGGALRKRGVVGAIPLADVQADASAGEVNILGVVLRPASSGVGSSSVKRYAVAASVGREIKRRNDSLVGPDQQNGGNRSSPDVEVLRAIRQVLGELSVAPPEVLKNAFYSRSADPVKAAQSTADVEKIVQGIKSRLANAPRTVVVYDMQDLQIPPEVRAEDLKQRSNGATGEPEAFFHKGTVYMLSVKLKTPKDVARAFFHETFGHFGLQAFGEQLKPILQQLSGLRRALVIQKARDYGQVRRGVDVKTATDAEMWAAMSEHHRLTSAEEVLAEMAEKYPEMGFVKRAIAIIRTWLRRNVPGFKNLALTDADIIANYILPARGWVERAKAADKPMQNTAAKSSPPSGAQPMFSRAAAAQMTQHATDKLNETFSHPGKISIWDKTVGSMYHLAERNAPFKRVFVASQGFITDVSYYASQAADQAPKMLPKLDTWRDMLKTPVAAADNKAIQVPINEGTLSWTRDEAGKPVRIEDLKSSQEAIGFEEKAQMLLRKRLITEDQLKRWKASPLDIYEAAVGSRFDAEFASAGVVWTDAELTSMFNLNAAQIALYREFRGAVDKSLDDLAKADLLRYGGKDVASLSDQVMEAKDADEAAVLLRDYLMSLSGGDAARADGLIETATGMIERVDKVNRLKAKGYAPLSRFGRYSVDVVVDGERQYFGLFETVREANRMAASLRREFGAANVAQGTMSQKEFEQFQGITPESIELFGNMLGLDSTGDDAQDKAFQTYLRLTKNNRSAMKRMIHRKGIAGFNTDVGRVLAAFVYSNARQTSAALHMREISEAIQDIPKGQGEVKDAAIELSNYIKNPREEAQALRGLLFAQYLGGSIASALVNFSQPLTVSFPYLSQYGGAAKASAALMQAMRDQRAGVKLEPGLAAALSLAEDEGTVSPQSVHELMAQAQGRAALQAGDGTMTGDSIAFAKNNFAKLALGWGKLFGLAEQINRRSTFIAAYRLAVDQKIANPSAFAIKAVNETQFISNKANKSKFARGAIGGTLMTFKSYSTNYLELLYRLSTQGGPEGKKAAALMLAMLFLMAGAGGLPFVDDLQDVADFFGQRLGYNFSSKKAKQEFLEELFGKALADFVDKGISGLPGSPIDTSGRMSMGNLLPGTGILLKKRDHTSDVQELFGPAGDLVKRTFKAGDELLSGNVYKAALTIAPKALYNLDKGVDMANTGSYNDDRSFKVITTTPFEAAMKAIGFQPAGVADVQQANYLNQRAKDFYSLNAQTINATWAQGLFKKDPNKVAEARQMIADWNEQNPDQRMKANMPAILKKAREMAKSKDQRIADTAPKALRSQLRAEIAERREAQQ